MKALNVEFRTSDRLRHPRVRTLISFLVSQIAAPMQWARVTTGRT
jgi:hypothetical protein